MEPFTLPVAITAIGGIFAIAFLIVKVIQETRSSDDWKHATNDLEKRISRLEPAHRNIVKAFSDLKDATDMAEIERRIARVEDNQKNFSNRMDELRSGQKDLDAKIDRLMELILKTMSEH